MNEIQLKLNEQNRGAFVIENGDEKLAEMNIAISDGNLIVFHTEVSEKLKGQGIGVKLVSEMIDYARKNQLKVVPLCTFVHTQFKRREDQYADIWNKEWRQ
jgi:predicted GNAT family acetyltransferase